MASVELGSGKVEGELSKVGRRMLEQQHQPEIQAGQRDPFKSLQLPLMPAAVSFLCLLSPSSTVAPRVHSWGSWGKMETFFQACDCPHDALESIQKIAVKSPNVAIPLLFRCSGVLAPTIFWGKFGRCREPSAHETRRDFFLLTFYSHKPSSNYTL